MVRDYKSFKRKMRLELTMSICVFHGILEYNLDMGLVFV
jgi:hypothetical protein